MRGFFDGRLPLVKLKLVIPGGAYAETKDNGSAIFVENMLAKGPEGMDEATFEKELYRLGMVSLLIPIPVIGKLKLIYCNSTLMKVWPC